MTGGVTPIGVVDHYNLLEQLEPVGPGDLFRARDTKRGRTVAIRRLPADYASGATREDLLAKARAFVGISHPNITMLFDVGEHDGGIYLVFEYLKGQSLRAEMGGRAINVRRAVELAVQMADAVDSAHAAGYFHGGLSPDSIVITAKGHAKIPALELATRGGFASHDGGVRLSDYESPEEARGLRPDDRSDVHSVGAILYEMLTTRRPSHRGASAPSASNPHVPRELDAVALKAVAPNPDSRHATAAVLATELRHVLTLLDRRGASDDEQTPATPARAGLRVAAGIVALASAIGLIWWLTRG